VQLKKGPSRGRRDGPDADLHRLARDGGAYRGGHFADYWEDCEVMVEIYSQVGPVPIIHRYAMGHRDREASFTPTNMAPACEGRIVAERRESLFVKDHDAEDVAERR